MFRIFSRRDKKNKSSKKQRNGQNINASSSVNVARAPTVPSQRQIAEDMLKKMPAPPDFMQTLNDIVYRKDFSEIRVDILRLIRRVEIIKRVPGEGEEKILLGMLETPAEIKEGPKEGVFLFMRLMEELITYFEEEEEAQELIDKMHTLYNDYLRKKRKGNEEIPDDAQTEEEADKKTYGLLEDVPEALEQSEKIVDISHIVDHIPDEEEEENEDSGEFTVKNLVEATGGDKTRAGIAVRCMCQGVAVSGHIQVKTRVCPLPTNDFHGERGWRLSVTLAEFVQFKHIRRENSVNMMPNTKHNKWEIEFAVHLTFDKSMKEIAAAKLSIVELLLAETMDPDFALYLKEKFNDGKLVVC